MNPPLVYVIIINWNGLEHLDACLSSLFATTWQNVHFLLVDNGSSDGSVSFVQERFPEESRLEILALDTNRGWSGGNNDGMERALEAGADYILLLNNDTWTDPLALEALVDAMAAHPEVGALAPRMLLFDQPDLINSVGLILSEVGAAWDRGIGRFDSPQWHEPVPVIGACGGALFLRASTLEKAGLLPEDFEIYFDDLDLCLRIQAAGYQIQTCPTAVVHHKFSATMGTGRRARRKYYLNTRNRFRVLLRHRAARELLSTFPRIAVGEARAIGRGLLSGEAWRVFAHLRAWIAALAYVPAAWRYRQAAPGSRLGGSSALIVREPAFCPVVVLPERGWYPPQVWEGIEIRPVARRAILEVSAGPLQVRLVNCYPALGLARVSLHSEGRCLAVLETDDAAESRLDFAGGVLTFQSESTFLLEDTGAAHDIAAWLQVTRDGQSLV